jgi:hypothetical protein
MSFDGKITGNAPAVEAALAQLHKHWESNGQVPEIGAKLESWLQQTGTFGQINVRNLGTPFGNPSSAAAQERQDPVQQEGLGDPKGRRLLGSILTESFRRCIAAEAFPGMLALSLTPELKSQCLAEYNTLEWQADLPLYFVWAQKSV